MALKLFHERAILVHKAGFRAYEWCFALKTGLGKGRDFSLCFLNSNTSLNIHPIS